MKKYWERLWNGLIKENPVLVLMLEIGRASCRERV